MSIFEKKLARFREEQARKKEKGMSKQDRKEVARSLKEQIKTTTDPEQLIKLTREFNRLTNPRYGRKPVKKEESTPSKNTRSLREIYTGSLYEALSDEELIVHHLALQIEKKRKEFGRELTKAEREALMAEYEATFA